MSWTNKRTCSAVEAEVAALLAKGSFSGHPRRSGVRRVGGARKLRQSTVLSETCRDTPLL